MIERDGVAQQIVEALSGTLPPIDVAGFSRHFPNDRAARTLSKKVEPLCIVVRDRRVVERRDRRDQRRARSAAGQLVCLRMRRPVALHRGRSRREDLNGLLQPSSNCAFGWRQVERILQIERGISPPGSARRQHRATAPAEWSAPPCRGIRTAASRARPRRCFPWLRDIGSGWRSRPRIRMARRQPGRLPRPSAARCRRAQRRCAEPSTDHRALP